MGDSARILAQLTDWLNQGGNLLLLTDFDGTLTPIVEDPADAHLAPRIRADLDELARSPRTRVGIISGRDLRDLRARVGVPAAIYAGCHGLEIEGPALAFTHPEALAQAAAIGAIAGALEARAEAVPGMRVEPKRLAVALHYRQVAPGEVRRVEAELARAMRVEGARLRLVRGAKVIEILPQVHWTKGECALWIRAAARGRAPIPPLLLYLGDDVTDEHAFERLAGVGLTAKVGGGGAPSRAQLRLADVAEVGRLFAALAADVAHRSAA